MDTNLLFKVENQRAHLFIITPSRLDSIHSYQRPKSQLTRSKSLVVCDWRSLMFPCLNLYTWQRNSATGSTPGLSLCQCSKESPGDFCKKVNNLSIGFMGAYGQRNTLEWEWEILVWIFKEIAKLALDVGTDIFLGLRTAWCACMCEHVEARGCLLAVFINHSIP